MLLNLFHVTECLVSHNICTALWGKSPDILWLEVTGLGLWLYLTPPSSPQEWGMDISVQPWLTLGTLAGNQGFIADTVAALPSEINCMLGAWEMTLLLPWFPYVLRPSLGMNRLISNLDSLWYLSSYELPDVLKKIIHVNSSSPLKVHHTLYGAVVLPNFRSSCSSLLSSTQSCWLYRIDENTTDGLGLFWEFINLLSTAFFGLLRTLYSGPV